MNPTSKSLSWISKLNRHTIWRRPISLDGVRYTAPSADRLLALYLHRLGLLGKKERVLFKKYIQPRMKVADIGANQGLYTLLFSTLVGPQGQVDAFEPVPDLFQSLSKNCEMNRVQNVRLHHLALSDHEGSAQIHLSELNSGDNRLNSSVGNGNAVEVKLARLDSLLPESTFDFIKIDVQGHELDVLKGLEKALQRSPSVKIYFEYWPFGLTQAGQKPLDLLAFFQQRRFSLYAADSERLLSTQDYSSFTDALKNQAYTNLIAVRGHL